MKSVEDLRHELDPIRGMLTEQICTVLDGLLDHVDRLNGRSDIMAEVAEGHMMIVHRDEYVAKSYYRQIYRELIALRQAVRECEKGIITVTSIVPRQASILVCDEEYQSAIRSRIQANPDISVGDPIVDRNSYVPENLYAWVGRAYAPTFTRDMLRSVLAQLKLRGLLIVDFDALFDTREDEDSILSAVNLTPEPGTFAAINREDYPTAASPDQYNRMNEDDLAKAINKRGCPYIPAEDTATQSKAEYMRTWLRDDDAINIESGNILKNVLLAKPHTFILDKESGLKPTTYRVCKCGLSEFNVMHTREDTNAKTNQNSSQT